MYMYWFFFFKQKTAYEMRISDWSSDVCSSDLARDGEAKDHAPVLARSLRHPGRRSDSSRPAARSHRPSRALFDRRAARHSARGHGPLPSGEAARSEEHTSELQSLMRSSYAVFCLKKKKRSQQDYTVRQYTNQL